MGDKILTGIFRKKKNIEGREREMMQREIASISHPQTGDWQHDFNSGMLASSKLYEMLANAIDDRELESWELEMDEMDEEKTEEGPHFKSPDDRREEALQFFLDLNT